MQTQLTEQDRDDLRYIIQKSTNGVARTMNLRDAREERFYRRQLELAGITRELFPQTHKTVDDAVANEDTLLFAARQATGASPVDVIAQIASKDKGKTYETVVLSSVPGGTINTTITLGLYDENINRIGDLAPGQQVNGGKGFTVSARGAFDTPIPAGGRQVYSIATVQYTTSAGTTRKNLVTSSFNFPHEINNVDPRDINNDGLIKVCLTRRDNDCDYWHQWVGKVQIPVKGSILYFGDIDVDANNKPVSATSKIQIARTDQGGDPLTPPAGFDFFDDPNTVVSGKTISWNLSWLTFDKPNFSSGDKIYYIFILKVQVSGKDVTAFITNAPSSIAPGQNGLNTLKIPEMEVVYGCLAADTKVILADGTGKAIRDIQVGEKVKSDAGGAVLTVGNTVEGTEEDPMIRITDDQEHSLLLTGSHPVPTPQGMKLAKELVPDDEVFVESGMSRIVKLEEEQYDGTVYNLHVGLPEDEVDLTHDNRTHFADGILVGDGRTQRHYGILFRQRKEDVLAAIPEEWHADYLNSLKLDESKKD